MSDLGFLERLLDGAEVEWKPLEEIIDSLKTGLNPRKNFQLNTSDAEGYYVTVREIQGGKLSFLAQTDRVNQEALKLINNRSNLEAGDVLFSGVGTVGRVVLIQDSPENWNIKEGVYSIKPNKEKVWPAYLAYLLSSQGVVTEYQKKVVGSPVVSLPMKELRKLLFPIPCPDEREKSLAIQGEIVRILDSFTELTAELTAELAARKKQYNHYRDQLLTFEDGEAEWRALGDVCDFTNAKPHEKFVTPDGDIALMTSKFVATQGQSARYINRQSVLTPAFAEDVALVMSDLPNGRALAKAFFVRENDRYAANQRVCLLRPKDKTQLLPRFLFYVIDRNPQLLRYDTGYDQTHLKKGWILDVNLPVPSLAEQARIVEALDKFDTLTTSLSEGLPREIALRQQQYEYYRDLLLSFPKPAEAAEA